MIKVSVVIPVFNGAMTVATALESVRAQRFESAIEAIVVDDGSDDTTAEILSGYAPSLKVISQKNRGVAAAQNAAVAAAAGEYIAFLDVDDVWLPDRLSATVAALDQRPQAVLAYSDCIPVTKCGTPIASCLIAPEVAHAPSMAELLGRWWPIMPSAVTFRASAYRACGGQSEALRSYHDVYLWMLLREQGPFEYIARPLVRYRKTTVAERALRDQLYYDVFVRYVRARYGVAGEPLIRATRRACAHTLGYRGLLQMRRGEVRAARRSFALALRRDPSSFRNALRLMRTWLPMAVALGLSGRTKRLSPQSIGDDPLVSRPGMPKGMV